MELLEIISEPEREEEPHLTTDEITFVDAMSSGSSIADAARKAGFSYMTGRRYNRRLDIKAAIRERAKECVHAGALTLTRGAAAASKALVAMAEGTEDPHPARVSACKAVLEIGLKTIEYDEMVSRLEALEALAGKTKAEAKAAG